MFAQQTPLILRSCARPGPRAQLVLLELPLTALAPPDPQQDPGNRATPSLQHPAPGKKCEETEGFSGLLGCLSFRQHL